MQCDDTLRKLNAALRLQINGNKQTLRCDVKRCLAAASGLLQAMLYGRLLNEQHHGNPQLHFPPPLLPPPFLSSNLPISRLAALLVIPCSSSNDTLSKCMALATRPSPRALCSRRNRSICFSVAASSDGSHLNQTLDEAAAGLVLVLRLGRVVPLCAGLPPSSTSAGEDLPLSRSPARLDSNGSTHSMPWA